MTKTDGQVLPFQTDGTIAPHQVYDNDHSVAWKQDSRLV